MLWLGMLCALVLAPTALHALGQPYELPYGPLPAKLHPSTYLLSLALLFGLAARGNVLAALWAVLRRRPLVGLYLVCMVYTGLWSLWRHGAGGAAFFVDTLWMPGLALLAMALQTRHRHRQLAWMVATVLVVNAVQALVEQRLGSTLIPQFAGRDGLVPDDYFRASALFGHPLNNALITASLMPVVWFLPVAIVWRGLGLLLLLLSMLSFGGRSSTVAVVLFYGALLTWAVVVQIASGKLRLRHVLVVVVCLLLGGAGLVGLVASTGLGERIFGNFTWDNSANVRLVALQALDHLDTVDLWAGVTPQRANQIAERIGLDLRYEAIENFWVALLMQVGLLGFVPFCIGLASGVAHIWRAANWPLRVGIVLFFVVGSGANTLAAKTVALLLLFVTAQAVAAFRPRPRHAGVAAPGAHHRARSSAFAGAAHPLGLRLHPLAALHRASRPFRPSPSQAPHSLSAARLNSRTP